MEDPGFNDVVSLFFFFLQVASFFVAMVVMVTMLALGIYLEPLPKVT